MLYPTLMTNPLMLENAFTLICAHYIIAFLGCVSLRIAYLLFFHPLSNVPGPKLAALTDLWKANAVMARRITTTLRKQHEKYGDVVRIGPNEISVIAPDEVPTMYGHKSEYLKGPLYDTWGLDGQTHFSDRDPVTHDKGRRKIAAAYSINHLVALERYCDSCTEFLFRHLDEASNSGEVVDMSTFLQWYTLDCVSAIGFGKFFGLLENGGDHTGVIGVISGAIQTLSTVSTLSNFCWMVPTRPVSLLISAIMGDKGPDFLLKYAAKYVSSRQALRESSPVAFDEEKDMLYRFMVSKDSMTSQPLDTRELISNTLVIIIAGADTTRSAMVATVERIYSHPPTLERLRDEISDALTRNRASFPITYSQATRLEFLGACIKEAMRLSPAGGMPLQRVVPAGGRVIAGRYYPGGTLVGMVPREVHYDPRAYGKDAAEWRPDRWLVGDRAELEKPNLVWGQGTRVCLGKNISLMEIFKLIPTIVYHYDIKIKNAAQPYKLSESWFVTQSEFFCSFAKREQA